MSIEEAVDKIKTKTIVMKSIGFEDKTWWVEDRGQWGNPPVPWGLYLNNEEMIELATTGTLSARKIMIG